MSHHSDQGFSEEIKKAFGLGPTGLFPQGKLTPDDEGEIKIAIGVIDGNVAIDFGKQIKWIGFTAEQAMELAEFIRTKAQEIISNRGK